MILCFMLPQAGFSQFWGPIKKEYQIEDAPATPPSTNIKNTGTDAIFIPNMSYPSEGPSCWLQVSVCDGDNAGFGWRIGDHTHFLSFANSTYLQSCQPGFTLTDPDVVVAYKGGHYGNFDQIYAKVVGIDPDGYTRTITYEWDQSTLSFEDPKKCPCRYGAVWDEVPASLYSGYTLGRRCTSPNIDANEAGETVIIWTEIENYYVEITLGVPFPVPVTPQYWKLKRGNVLASVGDIADSCLGCEGSRDIFYSPTYTPPDPAYSSLWTFPAAVVPGFSVVPEANFPSTTSSEEFYPTGWYANSDVSISEKGDSTKISSVFFNHLYSGAGNPLHVTQFASLTVVRCPYYLRDWNDFKDYPGGRPRIASPTVLNPGSSDFHVVLGYSGSYFDCETYQTYFSSNLGVVGAVGGTEINSGFSANIIDNSDLRGDINYDPCISYTTAIVDGEHSLSEYLAITWTNRGSDTTFDKGEIIGKLYQTSDAGEVDPKYSVVNQYLTGDQGISSIAARRDVVNNSTSPKIAYNWAEPATGRLEIKQSEIYLGLEKLEGGNYCGIDPPETQPAKKDIGILLFPNPAKKEFTILRNKEITPATFIGCEVMDMLGRKLEVKVNNKTLEITPTARMIPGIYKVKIVTKSGVFHSNLEIGR